MPELPEVETIKSELQKEIKDKIIKDVEVREERLINLPVKKFAGSLKNKKIKQIIRRGKALVFDIEGDLNLLVHLKLTGQLVYKNGKVLKRGGHPYPVIVDPKDLPNKYSYIIFTFKDGSQLFYNDQRKFGYIKLLNNNELEKKIEKMKLGPEPLSKKFTQKVFKELLNRKKRSKIKPLLMDQSFISGVGNIYAQEACFYARILPSRLAGSLTKKEIKDLYEGLMKILKDSIKHQGTSSDTYVDLYGQQGTFEAELKVYGRKGKKCLKCRNDLEFSKLGGRGTTFCKKCQK